MEVRKNLIHTNAGKDATIHNLRDVEAEDFRKSHLVILASGGGSNAECIVDHFANSDVADVVGIITDRKAAGVRERATRLGVPHTFIGKTRRESSGGLLAVLKKYDADFVVLAGYLRLIPEDVLSCFPERVINIHPALLPKFGGPGMYGMHVHEAVAKTGETHSGITIHLADPRYDEGKILFQASTPLAAGDSPDEIAQKVLALEHQHYPRVLEAYIQHLRATRFWER